VIHAPPFRAHTVVNGSGDDGGRFASRDDRCQGGAGDEDISASRKGNAVESNLGINARPPAKKHPLPETPIVVVISSVSPAQYNEHVWFLLPMND
jgi:hypothetical protein